MFYTYDIRHGWRRSGEGIPTEQQFEEAFDRIVQYVQRSKAMHYKNGREAKIGDKVVVVDGYGAPCVGILYDAIAGNDYCNGKLASIRPNDPCPNLKECLHFDDVKEAIRQDEIRQIG